MQQQHENLEDYLQWRGWDVEGTLDEHKLGDDLVNSAVGLLSHPLTFPLTLGRHVKAFSPSQSNVDGQQSEKRHMRLCCVGARSECTLPDDFWREFIVSAMSNLAQNDSEELEQPFEFTIDFVGPDVASHLESKTISLFDNDDHPKQQLTMNYHSSFLHEVVLFWNRHMQQTKATVMAKQHLVIELNKYDNFGMDLHCSIQDWDIQI